MAFRTFGSLNNELILEMDLSSEDWITAPELINHWNKAVTIAESHIHKLGLADKYFLASQLINTVQGQEAISLPSDLFQNMILKIIYNLNGTFYTMRPLNSPDMFENYVYLNSYSSTDFYRYMIKHQVAGTEKLILVPAARETASNAAQIWYFRKANRYTSDSDICDLPDIAYEFMNRYVREFVYAKESHENYMQAKAEREEKEQLMISTLAGQIEDNEMSKMNMDLTVYQESS